MHRGALVRCPRLAWTGHGQALIGPDGRHWRQRPFARRRAVSAASSSLRPVYQYARVGVRGLVVAAAAAARAGAALSSSSELDPAAKGSAGPATGATAAAACAAAGRWPRGVADLRRCVADPLACGGRAAASGRAGRCCWPAGAVVYCALAQLTRSATRSLKRVVAASSDSWSGRRSRASTPGRPV